MGSQEVLENVGLSVISSKNGLHRGVCENGLKQVVDENGLGKDGGSLADEVLEDFDEYWDDISDRLMVSRMVSDSVIKGMVTAVEQEAEERIAAKDLEMKSLKEYMLSHCMVDSSGLRAARRELGGVDCVRFLDSKEACAKHDKMREALRGLRDGAREHLKKVKKEIEGVMRSDSIKKIGSAAELVGLGGILQEPSEKWIHMDKELDCLKTSVEDVCTQVDGMLLSSKVSIGEWKQEQDIIGAVQDAVMKTVMRNLQEEFEEKLWEQNAQYHVNWLEKFNDISALRNELNAVMKSISHLETGLISHGSHDLDHLHLKVLSRPASPCEGNGRMDVDASKTDEPETYDFAQLKHLSKEELVNHFNGIITKMRRDHESAVQQKTEELFRLKREYLKEKGSSASHKKDEDFDVLKKKIPEVITKLDHFVLENESLPAVIDNAETLSKLKDRLDMLLHENHQLRDSLLDKKNEVKCLESQVSDASWEISQHSLTEANILKHVENLNAAVEDSNMQALLSEEVYKCFLRELDGKMRSESEDSDMEIRLMQEIYKIIYRGSMVPAEHTLSCETADLDVESAIMQELCALIFREAIRDVEKKLEDLYRGFLSEKEKRYSLETTVLDRENELKTEVKEKERLQLEVLDLKKIVEGKEKLMGGLSTSLVKEQKQFEVASEELRCLREQAYQQEALVAERSEELNSVRSQLREALEQTEAAEVEIHTLNQKVRKVEEELKQSSEERNVAVSLARERHDKELKEGMELMMVNFHSLLKVFDNVECRMVETINKNNLRLEGANTHLKSLEKMVNVLRTTGLAYKQRFERRCADLEMAEAEVDLLGDEVDALLRLLEKIYIALDHYSPILQHYPGIIEILKLVKRELSGESSKLF